MKIWKKKFLDHQYSSIYLKELFINYLAVSAYKQESDSKHLTYKGLCKYIVYYNVVTLYIIVKLYITMYIYIYIYLTVILQCALC